MFQSSHFSSSPALTPSLPPGFLILQRSLATMISLSLCILCIDRESFFLLLIRTESSPLDEIAFLFSSLSLTSFRLRHVSLAGSSQKDSSYSLSEHVRTLSSALQSALRAKALDKQRSSLGFSKKYKCETYLVVPTCEPTSKLPKDDRVVSITYFDDSFTLAGESLIRYVSVNSGEGRRIALRFTIFNLRPFTMSYNFRRVQQ